MTFPVSVIYLHRGYVYDVETIDWIHFTCRRRPTKHYEDFGAPPELINLEKGVEPKTYKFGESKFKLQKDLMAEIQAFFREYGTELPGTDSRA